MQVKWLRKALANVEDEAAYIAQENPAAAVRFVETVFAAVAQLADYPALGRPGRVSGTRELVIADFPYIIPYRVRGQNVEILRVFHTARMPPSVW